MRAYASAACVNLKREQISPAAKVRAEAGKRLRQFAADGSGADDGQARRQRRQREHGFVREEAGFAQAADRWNAGPRAGRNDGAAKAQNLVSDRDASRSDESRGT